MKYINVFETEEAYNASAGSLEKPQLSFVKTGKIFSLSVGGGSQEGPAANEIWYTTTDGQIFDMQWVLNEYTSGTSPKRIIGNQINSNVYVNGKGIITFENNVTKIGMLNDQICYPMFATQELQETTNNLTSIMLPNCLVDVYNNAIGGIPANLASLELPANVKHFGDEVMWEQYDNTVFSHLILHNNIETIGVYGIQAGYFNNVEIDYDGTISEWNNIEKGTIEMPGIIALENDIIVHCTDGNVTITAE